MRQRPQAKTPSVPNLFEGPGDDLFAGITPGDGVYPEPTEEDRRKFRRFVQGGTLTEQITDLLPD